MQTENNKPLSFLKSDLREDIKELRTPIDKRTIARKKLVERTKELITCNYYSEYGYLAYLRMSDIRNFFNLNLN